MKKLLLITVFSILSFVNYSVANDQNGKIIRINSIENFNSSRDLVLPTKFNIDLVLSFKLNNTKRLLSYGGPELRVGKILTSEQLECFKKLDQTNSINTKVSFNRVIIYENITDEQIELFIKKTNLSIQSNIVNREALKIVEVNLDLQNAILLHDYSKELFKSGKIKDALYCSYKAREIAIKLLRDSKMESHAKRFEKFEGEESLFTEIKKDHSTTSRWLKKARK
jgi:hypothetical protein